ncbi:MAG TPA: hypothetical protein ENG48_11095 [Candidatus Atribacteria bacterium]|nr:hypothetical protein [Candidatus Atribacteria bacterium]
MKGNGIEEHRRYIRARASTISSLCPICIKNNTNNITLVKPIAELHHIFGRATQDPSHIKESIFGTIPLCKDHHEEYPPLNSFEEYQRNKKKFDIFFDAYWSYIGSFNFLSKEEYEIRNKLFTFSMEEFINYFVGG